MSKYLNKRYGGWSVSKARKVNEGNHTIFTLKWSNGKIQKTITVRDNDMTALDSGRISISELSAKKKSLGKMKTISL